MGRRGSRRAAVAVLAVLGAACGSSGGDTEDGAKPAAVVRDIGLDVGGASPVHPDGGLFPTTAADPTSGVVYASWAREVPGAVTADGDPRLEAVVARSDDGGETFGAPVVVSPPGTAVHTRSVSPTQVEVGPDGAVYVLFKHVEDLAGYSSPRRILHLVRSDDGGKTFSGPFGVGTEAVEGAVTSMDMADLFIAPDGDVFVSFLDSREKVAEALGRAAAGGAEPENQLRLARSPDRGQTFAASTLVSKPVCVCCGTKVAQGKGTPLFTTTRSEWYELKGSKDAVRDPFLSASGDDGATWSKAQKIHDDKFKVSGCPDVNAGLAVDSAGRLHAAWYTGRDRGPGVYHAVSTDGGKTFSEPTALMSGEWVPYADVVMAMDGDAAWVAYEDRGGDVDQIEVARVGPDGAVTYSKPWPGHTPDLAVRGGAALVAFSGGAAGDDHEDVPGPVRLATVTVR